ncbi:MAG: zf-HC2 domain-containing protein [Armatimonadota bacterium]|nr:zf-HC2 domain-containing protein [Armatimonadota bacterium]MDR7450465.1 zf-HC2 domain-containing protein [Armatimonadota bacterium]MDR7466952.1 zf-HC2 domain-containing protein [Armatimonadota bacterium]MDR7493506.1 zf-HC2 domain-containing protein [Armatimonadota bacterium]MDR7498771.1 zf-HC2 domain-containing protein [Armatimonadota bacterium]
MTHARISRQLSAYLDGELEPDAVREVEAHLTVCGACRGELGGLRQVKAMLASLPEIAPPEEVWQGLRRRMEREPPSGWRPALREALRSTVRRPALAIAAAALIILLAAFPVVKGRRDRLQAADIGVDLYLREHALLSSADPFVDPAYLGLLIGDANRALAGARRVIEEGP